MSVRSEPLWKNLLTAREGERKGGGGRREGGWRDEGGEGGREEEKKEEREVREGGRERGKHGKAVNTFTKYYHVLSGTPEYTRICSIYSSILGYTVPCIALSAVCVEDLHNMCIPSFQ